VFSVLRPSPAALEAILREQRDEAFTYPDVGATRGRLPGGYRHGRQVVELGRGEDVFVRAAEGLRRWQAHRGAGVHVPPADAAVEPGTTVVVAVPLAVVHVTVACRVVYLTDEPTRSGFAYGTLPHHVIEGEEAFVVERDDTDVVRFAVTAFFRPRGRLIAAGGPLVHVLDQLLVRRYLSGLRRHVSAAR
jgi:uncharacterized protein (UPF0548 family)